MPDRLIIEEEQGAIRVALHREGDDRPEAAAAPFPFAVSLTDQEREDLRWYLEDYLELPFAVYEEHGTAIAAKLEEWGERLFAAVFGPDKPGREAYLRARAGRPEPELVLVSSSAAFLGLPWELLKDPARPTPLALDLAAIDRLSITHTDRLRRGGAH